MSGILGVKLMLQSDFQKFRLLSFSAKVKAKLQNFRERELIVFVSIVENFKLSKINCTHKKTVNYYITH